MSNQEPLINPEDQPTPEDRPMEKPAALVIQVQSWAMPIIGLVLLLIGLAGGYFGRPLLDRSFKSQTATEVSPTPSAVAEETSPNEDAQRKAFMEAVVSQTRHFKGDPNAPVTIIEFSDFQ